MAAACEAYHSQLYVKDTERKGKGLFTPIPIKEGDIIFEEKPVISCQFSWNKHYDYVACDNCMKSLETAQNMARRLTANFDLELPYHQECCDVLKRQNHIVKCPQCKTVYCGKECFEEATLKYHKVICNARPRIRILEEFWKTMHYPPETASIMLIVRMVAMIMQSDDADSLITVYDQFISRVKDDEYKLTHKLLAEGLQDLLAELYDHLQEALPIECYPKLKTIDGFKSLIALIGLNGQGIGSSSLSQYVHKLDALDVSDHERQYLDTLIDKVYDDIEKESGQFLNCEGSGLFQLQSRCNHSCTPNAEVTFPSNNSTMLLVALTDIAADEEICICYLDECQRNRSRYSRQKILRENYLFECSCALCESESDQPNVTSSEDDDTEDEAMNNGVS